MDNQKISELNLEIESRLAELDKRITQQLNEILHHPEFKELEAIWRGLHYLVDESRQGELVKIKILSVRKQELKKDFEKTMGFDQTRIFEKVYIDIYQTFGATPFGLLIGVYEFDYSSQDVFLLEQMSQVAAFIHAPFISATSPRMFGWDVFAQITKVQRSRIPNIFDGPEYLKWKNFRESKDSRYVGLCLPHFLLRDPYDFAEPFNFREIEEKELKELSWKENTKLLWGNMAFIFGGCVVRAYNEKGWLGEMGLEGDGLVDGLYFLDNCEWDWDAGILGSSETTLFIGRRSLELADLGFISLDEGGKGWGSFRKTPPTQKQPRFSRDHNLQLPNILAASRFAIYLKCCLWDSTTFFMGSKETESYQQKWLSQYVLKGNEVTEEERAKYPLREASLKVEEIPGWPGKYKCVLSIVPVYQLEEKSLPMQVELIIYGAAADR